MHAVTARQPTAPQGPPLPSAAPGREGGSSSRHSIYQRRAAGYARRHARFLRLAGGETQHAVEGMLAALLRPGMRVLDGGCGDGSLGRYMLALEPEIQLTLLDAAAAMLAQAADVTAACVQGDLTRLPFPAGAFDLVTCTWAVETLADPAAGVAELLRVLRPGGHLCLAACTRPRARPGPTVRWLLGRVERRWQGRLLDFNALLTTVSRAGGAYLRSRRGLATAAILAQKRGGH